MRPVNVYLTHNSIHHRFFLLQGLFELAGGNACHLFELAGEGAVVGVAAGEGDVGDGVVGLQQLHGLFEADFLDQLFRCHVEVFFQAPLQL